MRDAKSAEDVSQRNDDLSGTFCVYVAGTYIPRKEVAVLETIKATVIRENQAIRLRARKEGVDRGGVHRVTGNMNTHSHTLCSGVFSLAFLSHQTFAKQIPNV